MSVCSILARDILYIKYSFTVLNWNAIKGIFSVFHDIKRAWIYNIHTIKMLGFCKTFQIRLGLPVKQIIFHNEDHHAIDHFHKVFITKRNNLSMWLVKKKSISLDETLRVRGKCSHPNFILAICWDIANSKCFDKNNHSRMQMHQYKV